MTNINTIHGDVDLIKRSGVPTTAKKLDSKFNTHSRGTFIELGEHSGNAHVIAPTKGGVVNFYADAKELYIEVLDAPAVITHEEHAPILIEIGVYKKMIESEYDPFLKLIKKVLD